MSPDLLTAVKNIKQRITTRIDAPDDVPASLENLCCLFDLGHFERDVLLVCAGIELDPSFTQFLAEQQGSLERDYPTFGLLLSTLPQASWDALLPSRPLRYWHLIEVEPGRSLIHSPLRIDERILHALIGRDELDDRLRSLLYPIPSQCSPVPSQQHLAERIVTLWQRDQSAIAQLYGYELAGKSAIAASVAQMLNRRLYSLPAGLLPANSTDLNALIVLWNREARLNQAILLIDLDAMELAERSRQGIAQFLQGVEGAVIVCSRERDRTLLGGGLLSTRRSLISFEVHPPTASEQRVLWQTVGIDLNGQIDRLVGQFNLSAPMIHAACMDEIAGAEIWEACRSQARPQLDDLAQRIESSADWEDLILPEPQKQILRSIASHVRQRSLVYRSWGFAGQGGRGLGLSALFAGASGTGKTMAAEVLARELRLDLYRINLSSVVSKYIGETEKNLRRVFDAAETGSVILLFDEADALFGKRSEVKDSHDRYANLEVSYLLQRMEAYQGLAILTTNLKESLDTAFLRRIRFVVKFAFPDVTERERIWQRVFPKEMPIADLEVSKLARLNVAGGNIRNIALTAAFLAADAGEEVSMRHLKAAAQSEYAKLERSLTEAEVRGWD